MEQVCLFFFLGGVNETANETHRRLVHEYGTQAVNRSTMYRWFAKYLERDYSSLGRRGGAHTSAPQRRIAEIQEAFEEMTSKSLKSMSKLESLVLTTCWETVAQNLSVVKNPKKRFLIT